MDEVVVQWEDCGFAYGDHTVLSDVSLNIRRGEVVALAGPNGAGKTTLLKLLSGLLQPTTGAVRIAGRSPWDMPPRERAGCLAVVPQDVEFHFPYTVREVVRMGRLPYLGTWGFEGPQDIAAAERALCYCDLEDLADRVVHQLSGGERQRTVIARALAQAPRVLVLDEPMRSLDLKHAKGVLDILAGIHAEGDLTIVLVSHDLNAVAAFADRVVLLKDGRIHRDKPAAAALEPAALLAVFGVDVEVMRARDGHPVIVPPRPSRTGRGPAV